MTRRDMSKITQDSVSVYLKLNPPTVRLGIPYHSQMDNLNNPTGFLQCNFISDVYGLFEGATAQTNRAI